MSRTLAALCVLLTAGSAQGRGLPGRTAKPVLSFYANRGQAAPDVLWEARGRGFSVSFRRDNFTFQIFLAGAGAKLSQQTIYLAGTSSASQIEPLDPLPGKISFLPGSDSRRWVRRLATYSRLRYKNVYPGIDLLFYGNQGKLEYDFVVSPGADPRLIRLRIDGPAQVNGLGELELGTNADAAVHRPLLYQNVTSGKKMIVGRFASRGDGGVVFECGAYDRTKTLVIDPTVNLLYATYLGGIHDDEAYALALDSHNNSYILGESASTAYPISANAYQSERTDVGTYTYNLVLTKMSPQGILLYSTFFGDGADIPHDPPVLTVDSQGNAWFAGVTTNGNYPVTANAYQSTFPSSTAYTSLAPFFTEIGADGSTLVYSTFFSGSGAPYYLVNGIAVNASGQVYLAGEAASGLPTTPNAYAASVPAGNYANFVAVFNPSLVGSAQLLASTYFGYVGAENQYLTISGMALDAAGNPWLVAQTNWNGAPTTTTAIQPNGAFSSPLFCAEGLQKGLSDGGYVAKLSADLTTLIYGSFLTGGQGDGIGPGPNNDTGCDESISAAATDANGDLYIVGYTGSDKFPVSANAYQTFAQDFQAAVSGGSPGADLRFVMAISSDGSQILFSTFLGTSGGLGEPDFIAVDGQQNAWLASNATLPITPGALQSTLIPQPQNGGQFESPNQRNGAVAEFSSDGTTLLYGTYLPQVSGGNTCNTLGLYSLNPVACSTVIAGFAVDPESNAYVAGSVTGALIPTTANAFQSQFGDQSSGVDGDDIFFMILGGGTVNGISPAIGGNTGDVTVTVNGAGIEPAATCSLAQGGNTISASTVFVNNNGTSAICTFALTGAATGVYDVIVANPDGSGFTDRGAFTVEAGTGPNVSADIAGRSAIRTGVASSFTVTVTNSGDTNAYGVFLMIYYPSTLQPANNSGANPFGLSLLTVPPESPSDTQNYSLINTLLPSSLYPNETWLPLLIDFLPPGASLSYTLSMVSPADSDSEFVEADTWAPMASSVAGLLTTLGATISPSSQAVMRSAAQALAKVRPMAAGQPGPGCVATVVAVVLDHELEKLLSSIPSCLDSFANAMAQAILTGEYPSSWAASQLIQSTGKALINCTGEGKIAEFVNQILDGLEGATQIIEQCPPPKKHKKKTKSGKSTDPNEKSGSDGDGSASQWVTLSPQTYNVAFENDPTATLPASQVVVTDQLDPTKVDVTTVSLGNISFGGNLITVPANVTSYATTFPINSSISVKIQGSFNPAANLLKWTFTTIDPSTGLPPSDPTLGFLPPDVNGIEGQGAVLFTVMPLATLPTGTQIVNQATVVFDANAPIQTQTWLNTLDVNPPTSNVTALPATENAFTFPVSWSGTDVGSGIASYAVYYSDNGGGYMPLQVGVTATSTSFTGLPQHTYAFYSIATDGAGNVQAAKTTPDTTTTMFGGVNLGAACDVKNLGTVTVVDLQQVINEALGSATPVNDLNGDNVVNVVDIQIVMNAALGNGCTGT